MLKRNNKYIRYKKKISGDMDNCGSSKSFGYIYIYIDDDDNNNNNKIK